MTDQIDVRGGPGGIHVCLDEIRLLAETLRTIELTLGTSGPYLTQARLRLLEGPLSCENTIFPLMPQISPSVMRVTVAIQETEGFQAQLSSDLQDLQSRLQVAAARYEQAEALAASEVTATDKLRTVLLQAALGFGLGPPVLHGTGLLGLLRLVALMSLETATNKDGLAAAVHLHHLDMCSILLGLPSWAKTDTNTVVRVYANLADTLAGDGLDVTVTAGQSYPREPFRGVEDLVLNVATVRSPDGEDAQIGISKVESPSGRISWVVSIPGTRNWGVGGSDPMDLSTNLKAVSGDTNAVGLAVIGAMELAGVKAGQDVVLVGHSQGGLVAAGLAANPDFVDSFAVTSVVTIGSPIANIPIRPSVKVLALEHSQDVVPALDGGSNPDTANVVTVTRDLSRASDADLASKSKNVNVSHGVTAYATTGAMVDASRQLSINKWRETVAPILDPDSSVTTQHYKMKRTESDDR